MTRWIRAINALLIVVWAVYLLGSCAYLDLWWFSRHISEWLIYERFFAALMILLLSRLVALAKEMERRFK